MREHEERGATRAQKGGVHYDETRRNKARIKDTEVYRTHNGRDEISVGLHSCVVGVLYWLGLGSRSLSRSVI